jgi:catechol 2,3-dioxygenase-like lactoylglutathione lyase family enzyme
MAHSSQESCTAIVKGIHHVKLPVHDPARSREWYGRVLGFEQETEMVEQGELIGVVLHDPRSGIRLGLRRAPEQAEALRGFDPLALAVPTRNGLDAWISRLDSEGITHSPVVQGHMGWIVGFHDPDGMAVLLYAHDATRTHTDDARADTGG